MKWPANLPLLDHAHVCLSRIPADRAWELHRTGKVHLIIRDGKVRAAQIASIVPEADVPSLFGAGSSGGRHYTHDHETHQNPRGVWMFRHLNKRDRPHF